MSTSTASPVSPGPTTTGSTGSILEAITVPADQGRSVPDAATREPIGYAPVHTVEDLNRAISAARATQPAWAAFEHAERRRLLNAIADDLEANAEELAFCCPGNRANRWTARTPTA